MLASNKLKRFGLKEDILLTVQNSVVLKKKAIEMCMVVVIASLLVRVAVV